MRWFMVNCTDEVGWFGGGKRAWLMRDTGPLVECVYVEWLGATLILTGNPFIRCKLLQKEIALDALNCNFIKMCV